MYRALYEHVEYFTPNLSFDNRSSGNQQVALS